MHSLKQIIDVLEIGSILGFPALGLILVRSLKKMRNRSIVYSVSLGSARQYFSGFIVPVVDKMIIDNGLTVPGIHDRPQRLFVTEIKKHDDVADIRYRGLSNELSSDGFVLIEITPATDKGEKVVYIRSGGGRAAIAFDIPKIASGIVDAIRGDLGADGVTSPGWIAAEKREFEIFNRKIRELVKAEPYCNYVRVVDRKFSELTPETEATASEQVSVWRRLRNIFPAH